MDKINNFSNSFNELTSTLERKIMENELLFEITENINKGKNVIEIGDILQENIETIIDSKGLYIVEKKENFCKVLFPENQEVSEKLLNMLKTTNSDNIVSQVGENIFLLIHGIGISTEANIYFIRDISEHLKLAIEKAKILQMKNEFLAMASHDLKSPISVIKGYISLFESVWKDGSDVGQAKDKQMAIKQMDLICNKMLRLIDDFIGFTEVEIGKITLNKEVVWAKDFFDSLIPQLRILGLEKKISIECEIEDENGLFLKIDKFRMEQVLFNLVSNSIKYSKENKKIIINAKKNNDQILITVSDQGIGMSKTELDKVFNMFQRIDGESHKYSKGSGLGLFIANSIINAHVGRIYADSKIGEGTQISICLPA